MRPSSVIGVGGSANGGGAMGSGGTVVEVPVTSGVLGERGGVAGRKSSARIVASGVRGWTARLSNRANRESE